MKSGLTKNTFWFRHDQDAFSDPKLIRLRRKHGMEGYGIYFRLLEILRAQTGYSLSLSQVPDIAYEMHVGEPMVLDIVTGFELFIVEKESFFSSRLLSDMSNFDELRKQFSEKGKRGNEKRWGSLGDRGAIAGRQKNHRGAIAIRLDKSRIDKNINIPFESFWIAYDKKKVKLKAEKSWNALTDQERQDAMDYIPEYKIRTPKQFRQYPATFLNNKTWNDELDEAGNGTLRVTKSGNFEQPGPKLND